MEGSNHHVHRPGPGGAPVLDECENWFAATILDRMKVGDHCAKRIEPGHEA
jgi:flavin reductase (DIM6/NTAB) family NADH-FMN oxidoreductase RutF